jgi:hypothetical protein
MAYYDFLIKKGEPLDLLVEVQDPAGILVDFTNFTAKMTMVDNDDTTLCVLSSSLSSDNTGLTFTPISGSTQLTASNGTLGIFISQYSSSFFNFSEASYDLFVYSNTLSYKLMEGNVKLIKSQTRRYL